MPTAPSVPASPSRLLRRAVVGELVTALAVHTGYGADGAEYAPDALALGRPAPRLAPAQLLEAAHTLRAAAADALDEALTAIGRREHSLATNRLAEAQRLLDRAAVLARAAAAGSAS